MDEKRITGNETDEHDADRAHLRGIARLLGMTPTADAPVPAGALLTYGEDADFDVALHTELGRLARASGQTAVQPLPMYLTSALIGRRNPAQRATVDSDLIRTARYRAVARPLAGTFIAGRYYTPGDLVPPGAAPAPDGTPNPAPVRLIGLFRLYNMIWQGLDLTPEAPPLPPCDPADLALLQRHLARQEWYGCPDFEAILAALPGPEVGR